MSRKKHTSLNKKLQFEVLVNDPEAHAKIKGFHDTKHPEQKPMMLDGYGRALFHDEGVAREIEARFGKKSDGGSGEVVVVETEEPVPHGHTRTFIINAPWKKEE